MRPLYAATPPGNADRPSVSYSRESLAAMGLSELKGVSLSDAGYPNELEALAAQQLRTALIIYALRRAVSERLDIPCVHLRACIQAEERTRVEQLTHEAMLKRGGEL